MLFIVLDGMIFMEVILISGDDFIEDCPRQREEIMAYYHGIIQLLKNCNEDLAKEATVETCRSDLEALEVSH